MKGSLVYYVLINAVTTSRLITQDWYISLDSVSVLQIREQRPRHTELCAEVMPWYMREGVPIPGLLCLLYAHSHHILLPGGNTGSSSL